MSDDDARKALLVRHLRDGILYYTAKEAGLDVSPEPPQPPDEIRFDLAAAAAGAMAAIVEFNLHGGAGDLVNPSSEARQIAAGLCDRAFEGAALTLDDMRWADGTTSVEEEE